MAMHKVLDNIHINRTQDSLLAVSDLLLCADNSDMHMVRPVEFSTLILLIHEELERGLAEIAG